jgi:hypothetical protein
MKTGFFDEQASWNGQIPLLSVPDCCVEDAETEGVKDEFDERDECHCEELSNLMMTLAGADSWSSGTPTVPYDDRNISSYTFARRLELTCSVRRTVAIEADGSAGPLGSSLP